MHIGFSNINFKAKINYDRDDVMQTVQRDKSVSKDNISTITSVLDTIDSFSKMPEKSVVTIQPTIHNRAANLVCRVHDEDKEVLRYIDERSVGTMVKKEEFRNRYINNIHDAITDIEKEKKAVQEIKDTIDNTKNIKGIAMLDLYNDKIETKDMTKDEIKKYCIKNIASELDTGFKNKNASADEFINVLKGIDAKDKDIYILFTNKTKYAGKSPYHYSHYSSTKFGYVEKEDANLKLHTIPLHVILNNPVNKFIDNH